MRKARITACGSGFYHCMSGIIERRQILDKGEKELLRKLMRKLEGFSGVKILTYWLKALNTRFPP